MSSFLCTKCNTKYQKGDKGWLPAPFKKHRDYRLCSNCRQSEAETRSKLDDCAGFAEVSYLNSRLNGMYIAQLEKEMTALKKKEIENEARIAEMEKKTASHTVRIKEIDAELEKHKREINLKFCEMEHRLKRREMEHREKQSEMEIKIERYKTQQAEYNWEIATIIANLSQPSSRARTPEGHDESMRSNGSDDRIGLSYHGMENTPESHAFF